jgi:hypothetical protein
MMALKIPMKEKIVSPVLMLMRCFINKLVFAKTPSVVSRYAESKKVVKEP